MLVGEITGFRVGVSGTIVSKVISAVTVVLLLPAASHVVMDILLLPSDKSKA